MIKSFCQAIRLGMVGGRDVMNSVRKAANFMEEVCNKRRSSVCDDGLGGAVSEKDGMKKEIGYMKGCGGRECFGFGVAC